MTITFVIGKFSPVASSNSFLTVRTTSRGPPLRPPSSNALLILPLPWPGISTLRSRGIDITAIESLSGSARASRIVSDRGGLLGVDALALVGPEHHERARAARVGDVELGHVDVRAAGLADRLEDVLHLAQHRGRDGGRGQHHHQHAREQRAQRHLHAHARRPVTRRFHATPPSTARSGGAPPPSRMRARLHQQLAVARERPDRDPLLRPVVAGARGPELDGRDAGAQERHCVGRAVTADRHRAPPSPARRSRTARARTGSSARRARAGR